MPQLCWATISTSGVNRHRPDVYASDRYDASQKFGEEVRASGGAGLLYDSLRRRSGVNVVAHRPRNISGHPTDSSFRNYRHGNVARDRRPQTVAVMRGPWPDGRIFKTERPLRTEAVI